MTVEAQPSSYRRFAILTLRWLVPVGIVGAFIASGHLRDALTALASVSLLWAVPLVLVGTALPLTHAWRWCFLLNRTGSEIPLAGAIRVTALASLINYAAPGFLGAPAKAVLVRDSNRIPISRSLPTLAVEQLLDAVLLAIAGVVAVLIIGPRVLSDVGDDALFEGATAMLLIIAIAGLVLLGAWFTVRRLIPGFLASLRDATRMLVQSREHRESILALTGVRWVLDMAAFALAAFAVGLRLGLLEILLIANLSLLAGLLAPIPGGLGVREAVMASVAGVLGISIPAILAMSMLHRAGLALGLPIVLAGVRVHQWSRR